MPLKGKRPTRGKITEAGPVIEFGRQYRDRITGFTGKATGFCSYISGCDQVLILPEIDKDGKKQEGHWFDDDRLIDVLKEQRVQRSSRKGGPQENVPSPPN